jgi:NAD(P)-dependent dehydrogenase (short-subunit alcohol dehydrogenase family)
MTQAESKRMEILSKFTLDDRIALITGSGDGIGKGIALGFAGVGAHIVIAELDAGRAEAVAAEVRALGRKALPIVADTTNPEQIKSLVEKTMAEFGRIDILVNNIGGTRGMRAPFLDMPDEMWDATVNVNLRSTFLCSKIVGRVMVAQKRGNMINMSSVSALRPYPAQPAYGASKAAIVSLTQSLAVYFAPHHIRVNAIAPATTATPGIAQWGDSDARAVQRGISLGRAGRVEDIAFAAIYLASDAADFVSGITLPVTGGPQLGRQMLAEAEADWKKSAKY